MNNLVSERPIQLPKAVADFSGDYIRATLLQPSVVVLGLAVLIVLQADCSHPNETICECCVGAKGAQYGDTD